MRKVVSLAALMGALLLLYAGGVLAQPQTPTQNIPDRYIVVFEEGVRDPAAVANEHARENGLQVRFVYTNAIEGYAAVFPNDRALQRVQNDPRVAYVEQDQVARAVAQTLPWGIIRVEADTSTMAAFDGVWTDLNGPDSNDVNAYIIDSGIYKTHADLNVKTTSTSSATARTTTATATEPTWPAPWPQRTILRTWSELRRTSR